MPIPKDITWPYEQRCYVANRAANRAFLDTTNPSQKIMYEMLRLIDIVTNYPPEFLEKNRENFEEVVNEVENA